jgi:hypothetical protein
MSSELRGGKCTVERRTGSFTERIHLTIELIGLTATDILLSSSRIQEFAFEVSTTDFVARVGQDWLRKASIASDLAIQVTSPLQALAP